MICLALECSSSRRSVAVALDGTVLAQVSHEHGRTTPLIRMIRDVLAQATISEPQVQALAIGLGPGSYTGIRVAIAAAQGWDLAHPVRILGVGSMDAAAHRARCSGLRGRIAMIVDAHRGECYAAEYDLDDGPARRLSSLRIVSKAQVEELRAAGARIVGPELAALGIVGEPIFPDASAVAELAVGRTDTTPADQIQPIYLRSTTFVKAKAARTDL